MAKSLGDHISKAKHFWTYFDFVYCYVFHSNRGVEEIRKIFRS